MTKSNLRNLSRLHRAQRSRAKMIGTAERPRLVCFRSHCHLELQLVDDVDHKTLGGVSTKDKECVKLPAPQRIEWLGRAMASLLKSKKIEQIIFDRSGYLFHGNIAQIAKLITDQGIRI
jgi:large subunit ribosomal protein L18